MSRYPSYTVFFLNLHLCFEQTNHNLKVKLSEITEEKVALIAENDRLNSQLTEHLNDPESIHMSLRHQEEFKKEAERLRDENYRLETTVDDLKLKMQVINSSYIIHFLSLCNYFWC